MIRNQRRNAPRRVLLSFLLALSFAGVAAPAVAQSSDSSATTGVVVNVNTASPEELQELPGIGESRAQAIVELRKQRGGFKSLDDLLAVKGIGDATLEKLKPQMRLSGKHERP